MRRWMRNRFLLLGMAMVALPPIAAQESPADDGKKEEVVVVGSRIAQPDYDSLSPVTVLDAAELRLRGVETLADALRESPFNSFGSHREQTGSLYPQASLVDLRGLGANRTAVLIDGRRVPGSPSGGTTAVDLNTIPLAAVERIEVMTDNASALYGADAIGGAINVVLKKNYDGAEVSWGGYRPRRKGADYEQGSAVWGWPLERGHVLLGVEYSKRERIADRDRAYSRAAVHGETFRETQGISVYGNTGFDPGFTKAVALGGCNEAVYAGKLKDPYGIDGEGCGFAYADYSDQTPELERKSFFLNAGHELTNHASLFLNLRYARNETEAQLAPWKSWFDFSSTGAFDDLPDRYKTELRDKNITRVYHRFVGQDSYRHETDLEEYDIVSGVEGHLGNGWGYDAFLQYYRYRAKEASGPIADVGTAMSAIKGGRYDLFDPLNINTPGLEAEELLVQLRDVETEYKAMQVALDGEGFAIGESMAHWVLGFEYSDEKYEDKYGYRGQGRLGEWSSGDRSKWTVFGELELPLLESWDVNVAGRYEQYADFGSAFSPKVSTRFHLGGHWALRASWGEGFKPPDLYSLHVLGAPAFEAPVTDYYRCDAMGIPRTECPTYRVWVDTLGNRHLRGSAALRAEDSRSWNIGLILETGSVSASIDYFRVDLYNAISTLSMQTIIALEAEGKLPDGVTGRGPSTTDSNGATIPGVLWYIHSNPFINFPKRVSEGVDLKIRADADMPWAQFSGSLQWSRQLGDHSGLSDLSSGSLSNLTTGFPSHRAHGTLRMARNGLTVSWHVHYISSFRNHASTGKYRQWISHDVTADWQQAFGVPGLELLAGVRNLTNRSPSIDPVTGYLQNVVLNLYPVSGRVPFANLRYNFE